MSTLHLTAETCGAPSPGGSLACIRTDCDGGHVWVHPSVMEGEHEDEE